jgi:glycosyltransferase involved in cell wall biosynthesis
MNQPLVSILINNYNYAPYLKSAIDSSLNQTYPNTEILVTDDGSTDGSQEIIRGYGDRIKPIFKSNGGHASALNAGFAQSSGDIICFLDSDDVFLPTKVQEIVAAFSKVEDIDWVFHPLLEIQTGELDKLSLNSLIEDKCQDFQEKIEKDYEVIDFREQIIAGNQPNFVPQNSAISFSHKILKNIFPIPEDQKTYIGDTYVSMICVAQSKGIVINPKLSLYRLHGANAYSSMQINKTRETFSKHHIITSYWWQTNFPSLSKYTNKYFSKGLGCFWLIENREARYWKFVQDYFTSLSRQEKILVFIRSLYYCSKTFLFKTIP